MLTSVSGRSRRGERGQALLLGLLLFPVLLGFAAIVVDAGLFLHRRERVQHILDAAALAGAQELPENHARAEELARTWAVRNGLDGDAIGDIRFECRASNPLHCEPSGFDTILIGGEMAAPVTLMPVLRLIGASGSSCWLDSGCSVVGTAAACRGECTTAVRPVDIVLILDRTDSMNDQDLASAKEGALWLLQLLDPDLQHVGLAVLEEGARNDRCKADPGSGFWLVVPLSADYGDPGSDIVRTIKCLGQANDDAPSTNLGDPTRAAAQHLLTSGQPDTKKVIVLLTDGAANIPSGTSPCAYADRQADDAKAAGIEVYTIGYGVVGSKCSRDSGSWKNRSTVELLTSMASDDKHVFIEPKTGEDGDLNPTFEKIGRVLASGSRLVK